MWDGENPIVELDEEQCRKLLGGESLGRLATGVHGEIDIFPVNFVFDGNDVIFRTAPGTKLLELTINADVAFEIDGYDDTEAWSVVVKGVAHEIEEQSEIDVAEGLPLTPWIPTLKYRFVRVVPSRLTGRRFPRTAEPARY